MRELNTQARVRFVGIKEFCKTLKYIQLKLSMKYQRYIYAKMYNGYY